MLAIYFCIWFTVAAISIVRPRFGAIAMWFAVWLYPNSLLSGLLPLGIRLDDLLLVIVFLSAYYHYGKKQIWGSSVIQLAMVWLVIQVLGNIFGFLFVDLETEPINVFKMAAKMVYIPLSVIILALVNKDEQDIKRTVWWLCLAGVAAAGLAIITAYLPEQAAMFYIPPRELDVSDDTARRAAGALGVVGTTAVLSNITLLSLSQGIFGRDTRLRKAGYFFCALICAIGLAHTQTRTIVFAFGAVLAWGLLFSRKRFVFAAVCLAICLSVLFNPAMNDMVLGRLTGGGPTGSSFDSGMGVRLGIWSDYLERVGRDDMALLVTGTGMIGTGSRYNITVHNTYLASIFYNGVPGIFILLAIVFYSWRLGTRLLEHVKSPELTALGTYIRMLLILMIVIGMTAENFQNTNYMQIFFAGAFLGETSLYYMLRKNRPASKDNLAADAVRPIVAD